MVQTNRVRAYSSSPTPMDALEMLTAEHRHVEELVAQYQRAGDFPTQQHPARQVFRALECHAQLEEQVVYPAFEERAGKKGTQLVAESRLEHEKVKECICCEIATASMAGLFVGMSGIGGSKKP